ncbi:MAG: hypothetical protein ACPGLY_25100 [Rubripirellula sp.]
MRTNWQAVDSPRIHAVSFQDNLQRIVIGPLRFSNDGSDGVASNALPAISEEEAGTNEKATCCLQQVA